MSLRGSSSTISPLRMRSPSGDFYEANVLYQTAQNKLYEVAWKFDREKNGDIMRVRIAVPMC